ncbi:hypothetical protein VITU102760_25585 [Vibrio tubiashii]|uniref:Uncharacterized protein n=1 Tax=Vibrio tubiashii ATCC 19109 TaxID=1051646 RepID=F9TD15_9VIBR|nr:hypothetical protein [Vibrio tubiashii]AIW13577.1 hypothetical protein IX91_05080 [Vibrio tubiashii ATCC 19109]EGU47270.1 hypothetical protein VITU9109_04442 [Vibrio tubiashii ATCC 19109]EIF01918.1 hypothetical protein VT1337_21177 [Vibrio tubiashii NCIMB 1337 = ATCC 19106]
MSDYYFSREVTDTPLYDFPEEFSDSVPSNVFTYPNQAIPLIKKFGPIGEYKIAEVFLTPSLSIRYDLFVRLSLHDVFGVNWVDVFLLDKGRHKYKTLQLCNEIKIVDRMRSDFDFYDNFEGGEFISGMNRLVVNEELINSIDIEERLIFRDPGWRDKIFYHKLIVDQIMSENVKDIEFFPVDGYSEFN